MLRWLACVLTRYPDHHDWWVFFACVNQWNRDEAFVFIVCFGNGCNKPTIRGAKTHTLSTAESIAFRWPRLVPDGGSFQMESKPSSCCECLGMGHPEIGLIASWLHEQLPSHFGLLCSVHFWMFSSGATSARLLWDSLWSAQKKRSFLLNMWGPKQA
jgi:hypothetical protein